MQLHAVPGGIANYCIETTGQLGVLPIGPHARKDNLPIEEVFFSDQCVCPCQDVSEAPAILATPVRFTFAKSYIDGVAELPIEEGVDGRSVGLIPQHEPVERMN